MDHDTDSTARIARLEARIQELEEHHSRRAMFRLAGAAAVGTVGGLALGQPTSAVDDDPLVVGQLNYAQSATFLRYGAAANSNGPLLTSERLMLWLDNRGSPNEGAAGVRGDGKATGYGVYGNNDFGGIGVQARSSGSEPGLSSRSEDGPAIEAGHSGTANLFLSPVNGPRGGPAETKTAPPQRTDAHVRGELDVDSDGGLWFCVESGSPGTWRELAGPTTAGSFHPIDPVRAFDSRVAAFAGSGLLAPNATKTISVANGHDVVGGVTSADAVPEGATAVAYNVTVTATTGPNFVSVVPGDAASYTTSTLNWGGVGASLANGSVVKLDADRQVRVFGGDQTGSTHVIFDVLGFFL